MIDLQMGYSPQNLRNIRQQYNLTQKEVAKIVGVSSWNSVSRWETDVTSSNHSTMPYIRWLALLEHLNKQ